MVVAFFTKKNNYPKFKSIKWEFNQIKDYNLVHLADCKKKQKML